MTDTSLRILIVHNAYQHRGGEDAVVDDETKLLVSHGHEVRSYIRQNDEISEMSRLTLACQTLWSSRSVDEISALIRDFSPNVIHAHNTFPLISPSLYWAANQAGVPLVQTLHNFRLLCPQAIFLREGKICEDCLAKIPWRGAVRGCYRESRIQSTVLTSMLILHRLMNTWGSKVTRYIALNEFCRSKLIAGGLPGDRIAVKPNFSDFKAPVEGDRSGFLFVGRLSVEKGIEVLAGAVGISNDVCIRVVGSGPETPRLLNVKGITALGALSGDAVSAEMSRATALVLPSICYESFPRTLLEAFASRLPVIASRLGPLAELVKDGVTGLLFEPGNSLDLAYKLRWAVQHPEKMAEMGRNARALYEAEFTPESNYEQLIAIYQAAMNAAKGK